MPERRDLKACKPVRKPALRKEYALLYPLCQCCGVAEAEARYLYWPGLAVHHLIRPGRSDEFCNFLMLCTRCHSLCHGANIRQGDGSLLPKLTVGHYLNLKRLRDPNDWNPARLAELWARELPELCSVPEVLEREWRRRQQVVCGELFNRLVREVA